MSLNGLYKLKQMSASVPKMIPIKSDDGLYPDGVMRECLEEALNWVAKRDMIHVWQVVPWFEKISGHQIFINDGVFYSRQLEEIDQRPE